MRRPWWLCLALIACDPAQAQPPSDPPVVEEPPVPKPVTAVASPAAEPIVEPRKPELLERGPTSDMNPTPPLMLDHETRTGLRFGWPKGYRADNPSMILLYRKPNDEQAKLVIKRLGDDGAAALDAAVATVKLTSPQWEPWRDTVVTAAKHPGRLRRGRGKAPGGAEREALEVVVEVEGLPPVGVLAAWPTDAPAEELALDVVRHLQVCRWKIGSGCEPLE